MKKVPKIKKNLARKIGIAAIALTGGAYMITNRISGATIQDYIGGKNRVQIYENGKGKEMIIPVYPIWETKPNHCSLYARLVTENMGNKINRGNAWDLPTNNENYEYSPEKLSPGDIVGLYNPESKFNTEGREYSHVATYLGKNKEGEKIYAEQRGMDSRITTAKEFEKQGWIPKRIIKAKKANEK